MYEILNTERVAELERLDREDQASWVWLKPSDEFPGFWDVDSLWPDFKFDFDSVLGPRGILAPSRLHEFTGIARASGYRVFFTQDPTFVLKEYEALREDPPFEINSTLEGARKGFLPWQIVGFNKLVKRDLPAALVVWTTGTGKTVLIGSAIRYHEYDLALIVVKAHNKIETQRKLLSLAGIESFVISRDVEGRYNEYEEILTRLVAGQPTVVITNYEKLRDDQAVFQLLVDKRRCLFFWDEGPTKLKNRHTQLYEKVKYVLYHTFYKKPRPKWMRHWVLSATPIENAPEDIFNVVNLIYPRYLGTIAEFHNEYVASYNNFGQPRAWKNLDRLEAKLAFMTHVVDEDDPDVTRYLPEPGLADPRPIDWYYKHQHLYDILTGKAKNILEEIKDANILTLIQVMQMVCDAPSMIKLSAKKRDEFYKMLTATGDADERVNPQGSDVALMLVEGLDKSLLTNANHTKIATWRDIICEKHPNEKILTYSTWAEYIFPIWSEYLEKWGVPYVIYAGTDKQKQDALDNFRNDPEIRVFLSGDSGSDSIDISEARIGINYNIPWKWTTLHQRRGRRRRVNSQFQTILTYNLTMVNSIDERKLAVCERKHAYHKAVFGGQIQDEAQSAKLTREDLDFILLGSTS